MGFQYSVYILPTRSRHDLCHNIADIVNQISIVAIKMFSTSASTISHDMIVNPYDRHFEYSYEMRHTEIYIQGCVQKKH